MDRSHRITNNEKNIYFFVATGLFGESNVVHRSNTVYNIIGYSHVIEGTCSGIREQNFEKLGFNNPLLPEFKLVKTR